MISWGSSASNFKTRGFNQPNSSFLPHMDKYLIQRKTKSEESAVVTLKKSYLQDYLKKVKLKECSSDAAIAPITITEITVKSRP